MVNGNSFDSESSKTATALPYSNARNAKHMYQELACLLGVSEIKINENANVKVNVRFKSIILGGQMKLYTFTD